MSYIPLTKSKRNSTSKSNSKRNEEKYNDIFNLNIFTNTNKMLKKSKDCNNHFNFKRLNSLLSPKSNSIKKKSTYNYQNPLKLKNGMDFIASFSYKISTGKNHIKRNLSQIHKKNLKEVKSTSYLEKKNTLIKVNNHTPRYSVMSSTHKEKTSMSLNKKIFERRSKQYYSTNKTFQSSDDILTNNQNTEIINIKLHGTSQKKRQTKIPYYLSSDSFSKKTRCESYNNKGNRSNSSSRTNKLILIVKSNWGNADMIGIRGIKLYDINNKEIEILKCQLNNPFKDNNLEMNRMNTSNTLILGSNNHSSNNSYEDAWYCRFDSSNSLQIELYYCVDQILSTIELWNYSGKDLTIGAKNVEIIKDSNVIWSGVIPQGYQIDTNSSNSNIDSSLVINIKCNNIRKIIVNRKETPPSSTRIQGESLLNSAKRNINKIPLPLSTNTCDYYSSNTKQKFLKHQSDFAVTFSKISNQVCNTNNITEEEEDDCSFVKCNKIKFILVSNHGNSKQIGLTGLEFFDDKDKMIANPLIKSIKTNPPQTILNYYQSVEKKGPESLLNSRNETVLEKNMFLTFLPNDSNYLVSYIDIIFVSVLDISKIRIWNYNSSNYLDKGTKELQIIFYNNTQLVHKSNLLIRKAPGEEGINYSQTFVYPFAIKRCSVPIMLYNQPLQFMNQINCKNYETPYLPFGYIFKLIMQSSWGDESSVGINSIEIYNEKENLAVPKKIYLIPEKTEIQPSNKEPFLVKYINLDKSGNNKTKGNKIIFIYDKPICLSCIKIINYSKDTTKSLKDFKIICDDKIIYEGQCNKPLVSTKDESFIQNETTILFQSSDSFNKLQINEKQLRIHSVNQYEIVKNNDSKILRLKR